MIRASGHGWAGDALVAAHGHSPSLVDRSVARGAVLTREALAEAVDQAEEGILITDVQGTITYANPAFARRSGYTLAELVGQNPRLLKSGVHTPDFYERMWARLSEGRSFSGVFVNRRKDDVLTREATIISPYRDGDGGIAGFVGIKRTLDDRSRAARDLARERADRAAVLDALESLQPMDDVRQTAVRVCERIVEVPNLRLAAVIAFDEEGAIPLVVRFADGHRRTVARRLPAQEATGLREATFAGPWVYPLDAHDGRALTGPARDAGVMLLGAAPLRTNGHLPGVLVVGSSEDRVGVVERLLPALSEFGAVASALLAPGLDRRATEMAERRLLQRVIRNRAFESVFQPVVNADDGSVAGYELLTRFTDGVAPQPRFATARAVGLGRRLEAAAIRRGLTAARRLQRGGWLSVNVGPELLTATRQLARLLAAADRPVILEITEHEVIEEYPAIRAAVDQLGPGVSLAVDDAGAGYASLRHILELRPDYVKIDAAIVRGVANDPVRHALVAGLRFFAGEAGCQLIAEGVETEADRDKLRELGVGMGQGYLFGRPHLPADVAGAASRGRRLTAGHRASRDGSGTGRIAGRPRAVAPRRQ